MVGKPSENKTTMIVANADADLWAGSEQSMDRSFRKKDEESIFWQLKVWKKIVLAAA
jgi:hypothetical protein